MAPGEECRGWWGRVLALTHRYGERTLVRSKEIGQLEGGRDERDAASTRSYLILFSASTSSHDGELR